MTDPGTIPDVRFGIDLRPPYGVPQRGKHLLYDLFSGKTTLKNIRYARRNTLIREANRLASMLAVKNGWLPGGRQSVGITLYSDAKADTLTNHTIKTLATSLFLDGLYGDTKEGYENVTVSSINVVRIEAKQQPRQPRIEIVVSINDRDR